MDIQAGATATVPCSLIYETGPNFPLDVNNNVGGI